MRLIEPLTITDTILTDSSIPEDDHPEWDAGTAYTEGDRVILLSTHRRYEAIQDSTGVDPAEDDGTTWLDLGATERWSVFDGRVGSVAADDSPITYQFKAPRPLRGLALLGMLAAEVRVRVTDAVEGVVYDATTSLLDNSEAADWFSYFYSPINFGQRVAFFDLPIFLDAEIDVWVQGVGEVEVGQIVLGVTRDIGDTLTGTGLGLLDFSRKDRDDFGNAIVAERAFALTTTFQVAYPSSDSVRVQGIIARNRARPTVWSAGADTDQYGTLVYGFLRDFNVDLVSQQIAYATVEVEGLT